MTSDINRKCKYVFENKNGMSNKNVIEHGSVIGFQLFRTEYIVSLIYIIKCAVLVSLNFTRQTELVYKGSQRCFHFETRSSRETSIRGRDT